MRRQELGLGSRADSVYRAVKKMMLLEPGQPGSALPLIGCVVLSLTQTGDLVMAVKICHGSQTLRQ